MSDDLLSELTLIDMSRAQRMAWDCLLLLTAGIDSDEAERIASLADADRAEATMERETA